MDNVNAFLWMIRSCEGTATPDGYKILFGSRPSAPKLFDSFDKHPNILTPFTNTRGEVQYSSAAGAYQFIYKTWCRIANKLDLADFSPENQDRGAIQLIDEANALEDVKAGRFQDAIDKCSPIWASLPSSTYPQPKRTLDFALAAYIHAGGEVA